MVGSIKVTSIERYCCPHTCNKKTTSTYLHPSILFYMSKHHLGENLRTPEKIFDSSIRYENSQAFNACHPDVVTHVRT